jgi:hypothetical protein
LGAQQEPSALQTCFAPCGLAGQALLIFPLQPSSNVPQATPLAPTGSAGVQGGPHLPFWLHTSGLVHEPQLYCVPPQVPLVFPHSRSSTAHCHGGSGGPQRFAMPLAAQIVPDGQLPHLTVPPQPSEMYPHSALAALHRSLAALGTHLPPDAAGAGSQRLNAALHTVPAAQSPQSVVSVCGPQPSQAGPHSKPKSLQLGELHATHVLLSGSHSVPAAQLPHSSRTPHVLRTRPHCAPKS